MPNNSRFMLISCGILQKEIKKLVEEESINVETCFLDAGLHVVYSELEKEITIALEKSKDHVFDGIVVVYGDMCHPRIKKIVEKYENAVKVDALNCIDCLLGGHKKLLELDSECNHFYLSPGWMPSNLKKNIWFREVFNWKMEGIKDQFKHLSGIIVIDSLGNLDELKSDIKEFSNHTGLEVKKIKSVGLEGLKTVIYDAIKKIK